jgi:hypothetical protein
VDAETWLVLAETYRDAGGREVRSHRFETIAFGPPAEPMPTEPAEPIAAALSDTDAGQPAAPRRRPEGWTPLVASRLPEGFRPLAGELQPCGTWLDTYSDGLAALVIRQCVLPCDTGSPEPAVPGPTEVRRSRWGWGTTLTAQVQGRTVSVSGNLPDDELEAVLLGLRGAEAAPAPARE